MWNILIGLFFILGGMSGHFVLRGTNSSGALIALGAVLLIWGIIQVSKDPAEGEMAKGDDIEESAGGEMSSMGPSSSVDPPQPTETVEERRSTKAESSPVDESHETEAVVSFQTDMDGGSPEESEIEYDREKVPESVERNSHHDDQQKTVGGKHETKDRKWTWVLWTLGGCSALTVVSVLVLLGANFLWGSGTGSRSAPTFTMEEDKAKQIVGSQKTAVAGTKAVLQAVNTHQAKLTQQTQAQATFTPEPTSMPTPTITPTPPELGARRESALDSMEQAYIPAGEFAMGVARSVIGRHGRSLCFRYGIDYMTWGGEVIQSKLQQCIENGYYEYFQHSVYLDAFWMDVQEITNQMYADFLNAEGNQMEGNHLWLDENASTVRIEYKEGEWHPMPGFGNKYVREVTWYGARAYCEWAGKHLPTEAEWEKTYDLLKQDLTSMVARPEEWVADWYDFHYYHESPYKNPSGPSTGEERIGRIGDSFHVEYDPTRSAFNLGFRCAESYE